MERIWRFAFFKLELIFNIRFKELGQSTKQEVIRCLRSRCFGS